MQNEYNTEINALVLVNFCGLFFDVGRSTILQSVGFDFSTFNMLRFDESSLLQGASDCNY